ncbi:Nif3-like dinuclear metal center hexameric protein [Spiroplasma corruscae]|uniref:GTP cyclohydrolase 1 type 2 homolog n=1 Tax=Spiroplasma corruscae TaxID=216934 RepID=A0A222ENJ7_9MOLU|nr:Nif3-like dinuclear metal center hexameric protein [Spiroplasma corruscae]ASP28057.1 Nif3-like dinuclear metal center hexameric protein [Spiroplasma corruscae]
MTSLKTNVLINYLNDLFPKYLEAEWDKAGFQIEEVYNLKSQDEINGIVICLDVTLDVVNYAIENKTNLIISRHPFIFKEVQEELNNSYKKRLYDLLVKNEIQVFSIHTNYDNSSNQDLINLLETQFNIKNESIVGESNRYFEIELIREMQVKEIIDKLIFIFGSSNPLVTQNIDMDATFSKFLIATGAAGGLIEELNLRDIFYVTGEVKWHEWLYANQNNVSLLALGHYMENYFIEDIQNKILKTFNDLKVLTFDIKNQFMKY